MNLVSKEIVLRALEESDAPILKEMINDSEIERSVFGWSKPVSEFAQVNWIREKGGGDASCIRYAIDYQNRMIGTAIISELDFKNRTAEFNIKLANSAPHRLGIASKVYKLLLRYCFLELDLKCIYARVLSNNIPSRGLHEKAGFKLDGVLRSRVYKQGERLDFYEYSILKEEYLEEVYE